MLSIYYDNDLVPSVIFGGARPPQCVHWEDCPPPCSAAPAGQDRPHLSRSSTLYIAAIHSPCTLPALPTTLHAFHNPLLITKKHAKHISVSGGKMAQDIGTVWKCCGVISIYMVFRFYPYMRLCFHSENFLWPVLCSCQATWRVYKVLWELGMQMCVCHKC